MKHLLCAIILLFSLSVFGQERAFKVYNSKGKKTTYKKMKKQCAKQDIVMFGELHNNPIAHWLQLELTKDLDESRDIILGAEMVEADNQDELNAYLAGSLNSKQLDSAARLWNNHKTDYAPLINYAKDHNYIFVASNIPRRYASLVYKKGFEALDTLSEEEKSWIAPLPIPFEPELPTYKAILAMMGDHGSPRLVMAQAIKDATMAHFILKNHQKGSLFIHYNGAYHSDKYEGIVWYIKQAQPELDLATISTVSQDNISKLEAKNKGKADFIICVDSDMTTTY